MPPIGELYLMVSFFFFFKLFFLFLFFSYSFLFLLLLLLIHIHIFFSLSYPSLPTDKIFSTIMYNEAKSELTFTNPGKFSPRCFILGGSDAEKHSKVFLSFLPPPPLFFYFKKNQKNQKKKKKKQGPKSPNAGKFGEGGNLAILIFVAKGISITIATGFVFFPPFPPPHFIEIYAYIN